MSWGSSHPRFHYLLKGNRFMRNIHIMMTRIRSRVYIVLSKVSIVRRGQFRVRYCNAVLEMLLQWESDSSSRAVHFEQTSISPISVRSLQYANESVFTAGQYLASIHSDSSVAAPWDFSSDKWVILGFACNIICSVEALKYGIWESSVNFNDII